MNEKSKSKKASKHVVSTEAEPGNVTNGTPMHSLPLPQNANPEKGKKEEEEWD